MNLHLHAQNAFVKKGERKDYLKRELLPAADAHPFAHRP
jgi:hypothetical protein